MGGFYFFMSLQFSFIIPVYNRPNEVRELLESFLRQESNDFEIVIVEDGSQKTSESVIAEFKNALTISYYQKENTGPGDSRNYGMKHAKGNYYIILDSDCVLPPHYFDEIKKQLNHNFVHCFGGPDKADKSFTNIQKAIDFAMTSFITTGGIRGKKGGVGRFQPRSFNMGLSKEAFLKTGGFGNIHPGEDPELVFRIWKENYETRLFENAFVYHKRRINWQKFHAQVSKFGMVRAILNKWHPNTSKITYWFPTFFILGFLASLILLVFKIQWPITLYILYFTVVLVSAFVKTKNVVASILACWAALIQFFGYGFGFLKSTILVNFSNKEPHIIFPKLFFK